PGIRGVKGCGRLWTTVFRRETAIKVQANRLLILKKEWSDMDAKLLPASLSWKNSSVLSTTRGAASMLPPSGRKAEGKMAFRGLICVDSAARLGQSLVAVGRTRHLLENQPESVGFCRQPILL
ncbi:MAG: hypothetical protein D6722_20675, partial [Bacteroidetes bacterium]